MSSPARSKTRSSTRLNVRDPNMEDTEEKPERQRDEVFWFEDGNVILVAQEVEFRVYTGLLAFRSPVLEELLVHRPSGATDAGLRIAECPVVHLTDSTEDLRHLLRIYMPSGDNSPYRPKDPTFDMLFALIRLGHKYQLHNLVQHSLDYLKAYFAKDFEKWSEYEPGDLPHFQPAQAIGVVNVARLTGETSLLPMALLLCCTLGAGIVDGFKREDGTREHLTLADIGLCFRVRGNLIAASYSIAAAVFAPDVARTCTTRADADCEVELQHMLRNVHSRGAVLLRQTLFESYAAMYPLATLCASCREMVKKRDRRVRRAAWRQLPAIMGVDVDGWEAEVVLEEDESGGESDRSYDPDEDSDTDDTEGYEDDASMGVSEDDSAAAEDVAMV